MFNCRSTLDCGRIAADGSRIQLSSYVQYWCGNRVVMGMDGHSRDGGVGMGTSGEGRVGMRMRFAGIGWG